MGARWRNQQSRASSPAERRRARGTGAFPPREHDARGEDLGTEPVPLLGLEGQRELNRVVVQEQRRPEAIEHVSEEPPAAAASFRQVEDPSRLDPGVLEVGRLEESDCLRARIHSPALCFIPTGRTAEHPLVPPRLLLHTHA